MTAPIKHRWRYADEWGVQRITAFELTEVSARGRWGADCAPMIEVMSGAAPTANSSHKSSLATAQA